jgi:hypothetical protein
MIHRSLRFIAVVFVAACGGGERKSVPDSGMPMATVHGTPVASLPDASDPRAALFVRKGCPQCHSISALGVKSPAEIGPDLTYAYSDVQNRFNMKLEEFLHNPTGTMQMVLSSQIKLTSWYGWYRSWRSLLALSPVPTATSWSSLHRSPSVEAGSS